MRELKHTIKKGKKNYFNIKMDNYKKFNQLKQRWIEETKFYSSISEIVMHPAYQSIIGMGEIAIPFIIQEMAVRPNHWFGALKSITGEDPVSFDERGQMDKMTYVWLRWWLDKEEGKKDLDIKKCNKDDCNRIFITLKYYRECEGWLTCPYCGGKQFAEGYM